MLSPYANSRGRWGPAAALLVQRDEEGNLLYSRTGANNKRCSREGSREMARAFTPLLTPFVLESLAGAINSGRDAVNGRI